MPKTILRFVIPAAAAVAAFCAGGAVDRVVLTHRPAPDPPPEASPPDFALMRQAWDIIDREYVDRPALQADSLTDGAISGMVDALGDTGHSVYLTPQMVREQRSRMRGEYVGVGLEIEPKNGGVRIVAPFDNSPARAAGLRAGEEILKVDGDSVAGLDISEVVGMIVGPAGSNVTLTVNDPAAQKTFDVTLKRTRIRVENVSWSPVPGTRFADLRIAELNAGVGREVKAAVQDIQKQGMQGAVLDLRNDPGGELDEAIAVTSEFLRGGDVLLEKDAHGEITHDGVRDGGTAPTLPVVVLIDGGTASGAEIIAGALQDAKRAHVVGETTFGTGTVLSDFRLSDGSALQLAVREWLTPAGRSIWHKGIVPDIPVTLPAAAEVVTPASLKGMSREALEAGGDVQMKKALELLLTKTP
ncbi:MAG: S41 family peptidase [Spirochaetia bacterium]